MRDKEKTKAQLVDELLELRSRNAVLEALQLENERVKVMPQAREGLFRNLISQSLDGIALYDKRGKVVEWNKGMEEITGITKNEVKGSHAWDIVYNLLPEERKTPENYEMLQKGHLALFDEKRKKILPRFRKT
jgi:PAS domain-containing protein